MALAAFSAWPFLAFFGEELPRRMNGENIDPFVPNAKTMYTKGSSESLSH